MSKVVKVLGGILVLLGAAGLIALSVLGHKGRTARREVERVLREDWARFEPRIVSDQARWTAEPLVGPHPGADAAPFLSGYVRWEEDRRDSPIPAALSEQLRTWDDDFAHVDDAAVEELDLGWLSQLPKYGFWDLESAGSPLERAAFELWTEPLPRFADVANVAKARLLQGLKRGDARAAAAEVRELARLCLTTEVLIGNMTAVALIGHERRAHEEAVKRGQPVEGWTPFSQADQQALKRALWAAPAPVQLLATAPLAGQSLRVGRCAGLREGIGVAFSLRRFMGEELPGRYAELTEALAKSDCRLRRPRVAWSDPQAKGALPDRGSAVCTGSPGEPVVNCPVPDVVVHLPFVRGFIGNTLATIAKHDGFQFYRAAAP